MYKFNLNKTVFIELKKQSIDIIRKKLHGSEEFKDEYIKFCIDSRMIHKNGTTFVEMQMWEVMSFFGDEMEMGTNTPIGLNILLNEEDCEKIDNIN